MIYVFFYQNAFSKNIFKDSLHMTDNAEAVYAKIYFNFFCSLNK